MRSFILAVVVLVISSHVALAQKYGDGVAVVPDLSPAGRFDFMAEVDKRYGQTLEVIKTEFPDDYAVAIAHIAGISWRGGEEDRALLGAFSILTELKKKYAGRLLYAPSVRHAAMLAGLAKFYVTVSENEGPEVCGRFAQDGSGVLFERGLSGKYAAALDAQSAAYFEAVVAAIETPEYSGAVQPDDWSAVMSAMIAAGAPQSFAKTISAGDRSDPDLCPALAAMFVTSAFLNTPEGARTRGDFAKNLAGY